MSSQISLSAIRADNPRDFLAALGLLRLVDMRWPDLAAALSWSSPDYTATLSVDRELEDSWAEILVTDLQSLNSHSDQPLRHGAIIKTGSLDFRRAVRNALAFQSRDHPLAVLPTLLYASYSSQVTEEKSDLVVPTAFSFGNAQGGKNLLLDVSQLINALDQKEIISTLYGDSQPISAKTLRWNPSEFRPAAYRGPDPGTKTKGDETLDHPLFNVLAFIGLTFYPCVTGKSGAETAGFIRESRSWYFRWPIWSEPLQADSVFTAINADGDDVEHRPGIEKIWKSRRFSSDKSLYFAPAEPA